jgi:acetyl esterase/lipase
MRYGDSMSRTIVVAAIGLFAFVVSTVATSPVFAGPLADKLRERATQRQQAAQKNDAASEADEMSDASGPRSSSKLPTGVLVERDVAYGADPQQRLDVYRPERNASGVVILMVHGGAWLRGDKAMDRVVTNKLAHWLPQGHVFVTINYRMSDRQPDPMQEADDVARALAHVQAKATSWGADPARVVLMGHSAGAHLVALLSADRSIATRQGAKPWLGTVSLDSAAVDLVAIMQIRHLGFYDRVFGSDPAYWREASPLHRLSGAPPPMLLVCSSQRKIACPNAKAFLARASSLGARVTDLPEDLSHSQINERLGLPGPYTDAVDSFIRSVSSK